MRQPVNPNVAALPATFSTLGMQVAASQTNFLFLDTGRDSAQIALALLREGLIIKPWREPGYESWIRATIGTPAENDRLIDAMAKLATL
jgi:histidinol-phosphate aminotransferase